MSELASKAAKVFLIRRAVNLAPGFSYQHSLMTLLMDFNCCKKINSLADWKFMILKSFEYHSNTHWKHSQKVILNPKWQKIRKIRNQKLKNQINQNSQNVENPKSRESNKLENSEKTNSKIFGKLATRRSEKPEIQKKQKIL